MTGVIDAPLENRIAAIVLLQAYQVSDAELRERLSALARKANRRRRQGWWNQYSSVLDDTYRDYIALEAMAESIRTFQAQLVPGLLQTPEYIRAVTVASRQWETADEIEKFVQVRLARQQRLTGDTPLGRNTECVEVADDLLHMVPIRDSKHSTGPVLVFSHQAWGVFLNHLR